MNFDDLLPQAVPSVGQPVQPVAGVAQPGDDEALFVEAFVDGRHHQGAGDVEVRQQVLDPLDPLRGGQQADAGDVVGAASDEELHGLTQRPARRQHRVQHVALTSGEVLREAFGIGGGLKRRLVADHPQETDLGGRHQAQHAVEHSQAGAQDRHDERGGGVQLRAGGRGDGGLDGGFVDAHPAGRLIGQQRHQLLDETPEDGLFGGAAAQEGQLVIDEGMRDDAKFHEVTFAYRRGLGERILARVLKRVQDLEGWVLYNTREEISRGRL